MKLLKRNTTEFVYYPPAGVESDLNEYGEHTGEFHPVYQDPIWYTGNISSPSGHTNQMFYGTDVRYTHVIVMDDPYAFIEETGVIQWQGDLYDITAVRPSLNALSIAIRRQTADHPDPQPEPEPEPEPEPGPEGETGATGMTGMTGITEETGEPEEPEPDVGGGE